MQKISDFLTSSSPIKFLGLGSEFMEIKVWKKDLLVKN